MVLNFGVGQLFQPNFEDGGVGIGAGRRTLATNSLIESISFADNNVPNSPVTGTDISSGGISVTLEKGQKVLLIATCEADVDTAGEIMWIQFAKGGTNIGQRRTQETDDVDEAHTMAVQHVDEPGEGTFTYTVKAFSGSAETSDILEGEFTIILFN